MNSGLSFVSERNSSSLNLVQIQQAVQQDGKSSTKSLVTDVATPAKKQQKVIKKTSKIRVNASKILQLKKQLRTTKRQLLECKAKATKANKNITLLGEEANTFSVAVSNTELCHETPENERRQKLAASEHSHDP